MKRFRIAGMMAVGLAVSIMFIMVGSLHAGGHIKRGGTLNYIFGSKIPSYDLHRETTFGVIHPFSPYYSLLIRVNPDNPSSPTDFVCDVCEGTVDPAGEDGGKKYTFKIRRGIEFHDGTPLNAHDVVAT
ncbi:MAG: ABC transporter substrate-binding protein, partial [bacterium]